MALSIDPANTAGTTQSPRDRGQKRVDSSLVDKKNSNDKDDGSIRELKHFFSPPRPALYRT